MIKLAIIGAVLLGLAAAMPQWFSAAFRRLEKLLGRIAARPLLAVALVLVVSLAINAGITTLIGKSSPHIHDEFANLLAGETFAQGRICKPKHPLGEFFESIHVLSQPHIASKYPPATGLMLAAGRLVAGEPVAGMWLSVALACAAVCWALMAWMPPRWALLAGLMVALHPVLLKWGQVYWGGAEAMIGGALVAGAFRRLVRGPRIGTACLLALGMIILAVSRPFEGLVVTLIVLGGLVHWLIKNRASLHSSALKRLFVPIAVIMGIFFGFQGFYNGRITGDPFTLPYMVYEEQYAVAPFLVWQKPRPEPKYNHDLIRRHFVDYAMGEYEAQQTAAGFARETYRKIKRLARDYTWKYVMLAPLLALPWVWRRGGWDRFAVAALGIFGVVVMQETWMWDRYVAPAGAFFFAITMLCLRQLTHWRCCGKPYGRALVVVLLIACLGQTALWLKLRRWEHGRKDWDWQRQQMIQDLAKQGGEHLIVVRYGPKQSVHDDWVHNDPDIDLSPVVWARDMGAAENRRLLDYFKGRQIWLLESELPTADERDRMKTPPQAKLVPYPLN